MKLNQIIEGNSLEILKDFESDIFDLVITSPPYFRQRDYGNGNFGIGNESNENDYIDNLSEFFFETVRVTKPTGTIVYNIGDKYNNGGLSLIPYKFAIKAIESKKVFLINEITWSKLNPTPRQDKRKLISSTEPFFLFAKSKDYHINIDNFLNHFDMINKKNGNGAKSKSKIGQKYFDLINESDLSEDEKSSAKLELNKAIDSVILGEIASFRMKIRGIHKLAYGGQAGGRNNQIIKKGFTIIKISGNSLKKDIIESPVEITKDNKHPAVYPIYIIQELIQLLSKKDDLILDPFNGSGTTCVAAKNLGRNYVGIEINPEYNKIAKQRLEDKSNQVELFI